MENLEITVIHEITENLRIMENLEITMIHEITEKLGISVNQEVILKNIYISLWNKVNHEIRDRLEITANYGMADNSDSTVYHGVIQNLWIIKRLGIAVILRSMSI